MLQDQSLAQNILSAIATAQEAAVELSTALTSGDTTATGAMIADLTELLTTLQSVGYAQNKTDKTINLGSAAESALASLKRIQAYARPDLKRALHKLEYEFFPMLRIMYNCFYFWGCIFPDKERVKFFIENERSQLFTNEYIQEAVKSGEYKYDVSISVLAYNKLDYTKMCVESLLKNIPEGIKYELILMNHGSTDGTKKYFESLRPDKQVDIKINSCELAHTQHLIVEGELLLHISNDVIITPHAIENMLRAMREDEKIGIIVPTTPNISNLQTIPADYSDLKGLSKFAEANNQYDIFRHEMRTRLCNPISLARSKMYVSSKETYPAGYWFTNSHDVVSFPDDLISLLTRRAGYKNILAKDAYCHHFGSVTIKDDFAKNKIDDSAYIKGRMDFKAALGVDPWGTGFCYDPNFANIIDCSFGGHIDILGVNCGMGSNSLKVKELYKENKRNLDVSLTNVTNEECYIEDLAGVSDNAQTINSVNDIPHRINYCHIVLEDPFKGESHDLKDIKTLFKMLAVGGSLYVKVKQDTAICTRIKKEFADAAFCGDWVKLVKVK